LDFCRYNFGEDRIEASKQIKEVVRAGVVRSAALA
jgi:hypothetical protein